MFIRRCTSLVLSLALGAFLVSRLTPTVAQEETPSPGPAAAADDSTGTSVSSQIHVQLIRVRSDWSEITDAEETTKALESLVADLELPGSFREDLLGSASQILFPETLLAVYRPEDITALLAWMAERDLIRIETELQSPIDVSSYAHSLSAKHAVVPVAQAVSADRNLPYVKRSYGTIWDFAFRAIADEGGGSERISFEHRRLVFRRHELTVDGTTEMPAQWCGMYQFDASFPAGRVAVMHALFAQPGAAEYARTTGWDPVLVISPVGPWKTAAGRKRLAKPESLSNVRMEPTENAPPQDIVAAPSTAKIPAETTKRIIVFRLQHAQAGQLAELLQAVLTDGRVKADERTNSLVVFGTAEQIDALKGLIENLDIAATPQAASRKAETPPKSIEATRTDYATKQQEAASLARSLADETDEKTANELRTRLSRLVTEAFDLRQKLQRAELALLKERMQIVETRLLQRNVLRKEIIARRVENLLSGEFDRASLEPSRVTSGTDDTTATEAAKTTRLSGSTSAATANSRGSDDAIRFLNRADREAAWTMAYKEQRSQNAWPPPLSRQFHDGIKRLGPDASLPSSLREEYHKFIRAHAPQIDRIIDRRRPIAAEEPATAKGNENDAENASQQLMGGYGAGLGMQTGRHAMEGIVEWNNADYARAQAGFYWAARPSTIQVRLAQEDLWCYEAILRSIAKTNKDAGATSYDDAPIKRIERMEIGRPAAIAMASLRPKVASQAYFGKAYGLTEWIARQAIEEPTGVEAFEQVHSSGGGTKEQIAERLQMSRYVDLAGTPLAAGLQPYPEFKLLPVRLVVDIDQTQLPGFLARLAAGTMPVDVKYVEAEDTQSEEDSDAYGAPIRKNHVRAEILGLIRIFSPPDIKKLNADASTSAASGMVRLEFRHQPWEDVLKWLADVSGVELQLRTVPEGVFNYTSSEPEPVTKALETIRTALATSGYRLSESTYKGQRRFTVRAMEWEASRRQVVKAQEEVARWQKALQEAGQQDDPDYVATVDNRLKQAERDERDAQEAILQRLKTYETKLQGEERHAEASRAKWEDLKKLLAKGHTTQEELDAEEAEFNKREAACRFTRDCVEGYRKLAESPDLMPSTATSQDQPVTPTETGRAESNAKTGTTTARVPNTPTSSALGARPTLQLRSPADFQSAARDAKKQVGLMQAKLDSVLGDREQLEDRLDFDYTAYLDSVNDDLSSAKLQLELIQGEYATQLRLLEADLQKAQSAAAITERECEMVQEAAARAPDTFTSTQVAEYIHKRDKDMLRVDQAKALLELYRKLGESHEFTPENGGQSEGDQAGSEGPVPGAEVLPRNWAESLFKETRHDFGTVAVGAKLEHRFTIENPFLEDVHIAQITAAAGLSARITKTLLKTHETADIVVEVDPRQLSAAASSRIMVEIDKPFPAQVQLDVRLSKKPASETPE
jgi:type II/III secretion system protein/uncharacterized protein DUF1573